MDLSSSWTAYLRRQATASRITTEDAQGLARSPPSSNFDKTRSQRNLWSLDDDHPTPSRRPRAYVDDDHGNAESSDPTPILPRRAWAESSLKRDSSVSRPPPRRRPMHAVAPSVSPGDDPWDFDRPPQRGKLWSPDDTPRKAYAARPSRNQRTQRTQPAFTASSTKHDEDSTFKLIKQPETLSISQEQVVAEVKGIYAGLVMIESKCIEVCRYGYTALSSNFVFLLPASLMSLCARSCNRGLTEPGASSQSAQYNSTANRLNNEQWQALIALHRTLLHEHHDFFLAPQRQLFSSDNPFNKIPRKLNWRRPSWDPQYIQQFLHYSKRFTTLLSSNASLLDFAGGYLLRLLEQVGELILILCRRFIGRCPQQLLLYIFLFFYCFSEFVKGMRPLCTTMPWTIWPSLVVLWGVCWMFPQPVPSLSVTPEQQPPETDGWYPKEL
ncbi:hypothetical protein GQ53DRAFT_435584 [Thozetella sp. PMI_491]|nr:hypothetical protein GQ53DRAFT_435584 [Thozetella sp. PMI_491]